MPGDDMPLGISQNRIGEAERFDGRPDLLDLALRMGTGIARIRNEVTDRAVSNGRPLGRSLMNPLKPKRSPTFRNAKRVSGS
jgi:hypothetical protein